MNRLTHILLTLLTAFAVMTASAQEPLAGSDKKKALAAITASYINWETAALDAKVKVQGLPVSITAKIYMERGKSIVMSLRAPFLGEVARAAVTADTLLLVNKQNNTYCVENLAERLSGIPVGVEDLQNALLGRAFVAGSGQLSVRNADKVEICAVTDSEGNDAGWIIIPEQIEADGTEVSYGFTASPDGQLSQFVAMPQTQTAAAGCSYTYDYSSTRIEAIASFSGKNYTANLSYSSPAYNGGAVAMPEISASATRLDFRTFIRKIVGK